MIDRRARAGRRRRIARFALASTVVHAVLLLGADSSTPALTLGTARPALSVSLQPAPPAAARRPPLTPATAIDPAAAASPAGPALPATQEASAATDPDPAASGVQAQVISELARYFRYPPLARQRGWEGRVLLGVRVEPDGQLHQQRVLRTSGFAILDHAALDSLRRVARVADPGATRQDLQISVLYRLTDTY